LIKIFTGLKTDFLFLYFCALFQKNAVNGKNLKCHVVQTKKIPGEIGGSPAQPSNQSGDRTPPVWEVVPAFQPFLQSP